MAQMARASASIAKHAWLRRVPQSSMHSRFDKPPRLPFRSLCRRLESIHSTGYVGPNPNPKARVHGSNCGAYSRTVRIRRMGRGGKVSLTI